MRGAGQRVMNLSPRHRVVLSSIYYRFFGELNSPPASAPDDIQTLQEPGWDRRGGGQVDTTRSRKISTDLEQVLRPFRSRSEHLKEPAPSGAQLPV